jgi:hypothetical protein
MAENRQRKRVAAMAARCFMQSGRSFEVLLIAQVVYGSPPTAGN